MCLLSTKLMRTEAHHQKVHDEGGKLKNGLTEISGAAALLLQQNPKVTPDLATPRLVNIAWKAFPVRHCCRSGRQNNLYQLPQPTYRTRRPSGHLGGVKQYQLAAPGNHRAVSGHSHNATTKQVNLLSGTNVVRGSDVIWRNRRRVGYRRHARLQRRLGNQCRLGNRPAGR